MLLDNKSYQDSDLFKILESELQAKDAKKYILPPVKIAYDLLKKNGFDDLSCSASILWPLYKDDNYDHKLLETKIDPKLVNILKASQMIRINFSKLSHAEFLAEQLKQLLVAASSDIRVIFIQIAYWKAQLEFSISNKLEDCQKIAKLSLDVYAPIAHRFGFYLIKNEMEEQSFEQLYPKKAAEIRYFLSDYKKNQLHIFNNLKNKFSKLLQDDHIEHDFSLRTKGVYSTYKKALGYGIDFRKLTDLIACRLVVPSVLDCYKVIGMVHSEYSPIEGRFRDYISNPKSNGYSSLHTSVIDEKGLIFEVQVRTKLMHQQAEYGLAAHWQYKSGIKNEKINLEHKHIAWLRELINTYDSQEDSNQALDSLKRELYYNSIFVFSPQGKMIKLPQDASVIDFAYEIHSDIGDECAGAKINGKFVSIRTKLENGQIVEIIRNKKTKPNSDWLKHCITNKAQQKIRSKIKEQSSFEAAKHGEKIITKLLPNYGLSNIDSFLKHENLAKFMKKKSMVTISELFQAISHGTIEAADCLQYLENKQEKENKPSSLQGRIKNFFNKKLPAKYSNKGNLKGIPTRIAQCCQPLHGDEVLGVISNSGLIKIHHAECSNLKKMDSAQLIQLDWNMQATNNLSLPVIFEFDGGIKMLNRVTSAINDLKIKMSRSNTELADDGDKARMRLQVHLELDSLSQLNDLKNKLKRYPVVIKHSLEQINATRVTNF